MISDDIIATNTQKVIRYLLLHCGKPCFEREIARGAKISYGSANSVLRQLYKKKLIQKKTEGKMCFYSTDLTNPYIKEVKILNNLLLIEPLIEKLKPYSHKIILYGSWSNGTDAENSDIDIFIISSDEEKVRSIIGKFSYSSTVGNHKIQAVIKSPADFLRRDSRETVFLNEVEKGKILWEREINEDNL